MMDPSAAQSTEPDEPSDWGTFVAPTTEELGQQLPEFEILELIGQGGMGAVYKANQTKLDRIVALKLLAPLQGPDVHNFAERFEMEGQAMAQMSHPNIVKGHDLGQTENGQRYIVMEYVDGSDLHNAIQTGQLNTGHALSWIPQICGALQYAHEHGVVHRDLKPANVLISKEGSVKIVDFGLATLVGASKPDRKITGSDVAMGTLEYAPPESFEDGVELDHRADIFSLGVLMYEMLTGQTPQGSWTPPSQLARGQFDPRLDDVITRCMQPRREDRYQSMAEVAQAVRQLRLPQTAPSQQPVIVRKKLAVGQGARRRPRPAAAVVVPPKRGSSAAVWVALGIAGVAIAAIVAVVMKRAEPEDDPYAVAGGGDPNPPIQPTPDPGPRPDPKPEPPQPPTFFPPDPEPEPEPEPPRPEPEPMPVLTPVPGEWFDALAGIDLEAAAVRGVWELGEDGAIIGSKGETRNDRPLLGLPISPGPNYDLEIVLQRGKGVGDVMIELPVRDERYIELKLADWEKWTGFPVDGVGPNDGSPARTQTMIETGRDHRLLIQIRAVGDDAQFRLAVDGAPALEWAGPIESLSDEASLRIRRDVSRIHIGSYKDPVIWSSIRVRNDGQTGVQPPNMVGGSEEVEAVLERQRLEIAQAAGPEHQTGLNQLNASYARVLNQFVSGSDAALREAARSEIDRLRQQLPVSDEEDPDSLPPKFLAARNVYETELAKLDARRDAGVLPILQSHLAELRTLTFKLSNEGRDGESDFAAQAAAELEARFDAASSVAVATHSAAGRLQRPLFPISRPRDRGGVVIWPRDGDRGVMDRIRPPSGLGNSIVQISGRDGQMAALDYNGEVVMWGYHGSREDRISSLRDINRIWLTAGPYRFHLACIDTRGKIHSRMGNWDDPDGARLKASAIHDSVSVSLRIQAAYAVCNDGTVGNWSERVDYPAPIGLENVVKIVNGPGIWIAIKEDMSLEKWGGGNGLSSFPDDITHARDLYFNATYEDYGFAGLAQLPDGAWRVFGRWEQHRDDLAAKTAGQEIEQVVPGLDAFAVQTRDKRWHFFGDNLDTDFCERQADRCFDLVILNNYVVGLKAR